MGGMGRPVEKAKNFGVSMRRLVGFLKPHMVKLIVVLVLAIGSTMFAIFAPKIMGHATTKIFAGLMAKMMAVAIPHAKASAR